MQYVSVVEEGGVCLVTIGEYRLLSVEPSWQLRPANNYQDDVSAIQKAMLTYPTTFDKYGNRWVRCEFKALVGVIRSIINAFVPERVPMLFMRASVRRAVVALGCVHVRSRQLPGDLLREVAERAHVDEVEALIELFVTYEKLIRINGLHARVIKDGFVGARLRVRELSRYSEYMRFVGTRFRVKVDAYSLVFDSVDSASGFKVVIHTGDMQRFMLNTPCNLKPTTQSSS